MTCLLIPKKIPSNSLKKFPSHKKKLEVSHQHVCGEEAERSTQAKIQVMVFVLSW